MFRTPKHGRFPGGVSGSGHGKNVDANARAVRVLHELAGVKRHSVHTSCLARLAIDCVLE